VCFALSLHPLTCRAFQAVKRAKADSAPVDPGRVCNLAAAVICGLCDTAATGRWQQQHLDAALLLVSCIPASSYATAAPYCCKLVTLLAPQHAAAGSSVAAAAASLALAAADEGVTQLFQATRACVAAAADGERARSCLHLSRVSHSPCSAGGDMLPVLQPWVALHASHARAFAAFAAAAACWGCGVAVAQVAREQVPRVRNLLCLRPDMRAGQG